MTFRVLDALPILVIRYGETINKVPSGDRKGLENQKVMGFRTLSGQILALDVDGENYKQVKLWIEPPAPPTISGIRVHPPKESHDLHRTVLTALASKKGIYLEAENKKGLENLLSWYS